MLGVGGEWNVAEFAAQGIPPAERDARTEDTVRACRELWKPGLATYHGQWIDFQNVVSEPAPVTPGGPPIWWGGNALKRRTQRRVVEFCAGWLSREAADYDETARSVEALRNGCIEAGRNPEPLSIRSSVIPTDDWQDATSKAALYERVLSNCVKLAEAGVTHFNIPQNYFQLSFEDLAELLALLRAA
jgi:alkanesulfonate monooxygenase SsuD/methylene tetrahydromethanopterin reductase-like flavin-dependent oxidoreductase (luciferase family)